MSWSCLHGFVWYHTEIHSLSYVVVQVSYQAAQPKKWHSWQNQNYSRLAGLSNTFLDKKHPYFDVSNSEGFTEKRNYTAMSVMLLIIMIFSISSSESHLAVLCILAIECFWIQWLIKMKVGRL